MVLIYLINLLKVSKIPQFVVRGAMNDIVSEDKNITPVTSKISYQQRVERSGHQVEFYGLLGFLAVVNQLFLLCYKRSCLKKGIIFSCLMVIISEVELVRI